VWAQDLEGNQFVFEIQLSTTFIDVVLEREAFYQAEEIYLVWIFDRFSTFPEEQAFTEKDIFYANNCNAFVVNVETMKRSLEQKELHLECHYKKPLNPKSCDYEIEEKWYKEIVRFSELKRDRDNYSVYFSDYRSAREEIESKIQREKDERKLDCQRKLEASMARLINESKDSAHEGSSEQEQKKHSWMDDRYTCEICGVVTTDWNQGKPDTKTCICRKCSAG
tara:strand:- start:193 stop:861 length:669 start_codon:yes stop_codon:yes gene_type:complete